MTLYSQAKAAALSDDDIVLEHVELVKRIAHHLLGKLPATVDVDDLMQAGLIGLIEAASNYNSAKGASFETYAGIRIRGAMLDEVRKLDWTPRSVHQKHRHVSVAIQKLEGELGRNPTEREIAAELNVDIDEYHRILADSSSCKLFSIEQPSEHHESRIDVADDIDEIPDAYLASDDLRGAIAAAIGKLPEREALVLSLYYQRELNLKEIGAVLDVSESRVSQIHGQALQRLRALIGFDFTDLL
ncbi:MAG: RNA polymerase sigma factor FliA [Pseudomonadota bacterium]